MITQAYISHYKSIADANLSFSDINVIVGTNGVGKSNILDALYFIHDCFHDDLDTAITRRHGIESIRQWSKFRPYNITIELSFVNQTGSGKYRVTLGSTRGTYKVVEEYGEWCGRNPLSPDVNGERRTSRFARLEDGDVKISTDHDGDYVKYIPKIAMPQSELFGTTLAGPGVSFVSFLLRALSEELQSFITYSIYPNTLREPRVVSRQERLVQDGSNLASILKRINSGHSRSKSRLVESLKVIMPDLTDFIVRSAGGYYVPLVKVGEASDDSHYFNMSQLSDGTLRLLGLLTAFYQPDAPNIIALEEPEQMVHPGILPVIVDAAKEFVADGEGRQVFITTHSPSLLDLIEPESIIWTRFSGGVTTCGDISARQLSLVKRHLFTPGEIFMTEGFLEQ